MLTTIDDINKRGICACKDQKWSIVVLDRSFVNSWRKQKYKNPHFIVYGEKKLRYKYIDEYTLVYVLVTIEIKMCSRKKRKKQRKIEEEEENKMQQDHSKVLCINHVATNKHNYRYT